MSSQPIRLAVIIGSTRTGRFAPTVARWFVGQAEQREDVIVDVIDLAEIGLPEPLGAEPGPEGAAVRSRLAEAEAFVVVTPEYNHSYPAAIKVAIDWHYDEWVAKPVAFVSYGGRAGGLRAVEHLRQVFAEVHAVPIRDTVSFHGARDSFDDHGEPKEAAEYAAAAKTLLDQLVWWALCLTEAKAKRPYQL
ncbi:NAD(P)H-dependent FMN reductase [Saccharothrix carnea]|uniref:NAD(P)H-dependent FMN reductase n=1 Tax=Saccharothrix carnea TaxID=1280637 RepID=A0A2P8IGY0_SACCR|nr:NAD(P)H-dependent oxidoreductase [Saccharothrix carnea]PSL57719.1 NAD(P)H-dependent FMN reductase [Saccharothrix carnea]